MYKPLSKRKGNSQEHWLNTFENIDKIITEDHIKRLTFETVNELIISTTGKKVHYGWSGGKDALVLEKLCNMSGIQDRLLIKTHLEYKDMIEFLDKNTDDKTTVLYTFHNLEWLSKNQNNLFPTDYKYKGNYMKELRKTMEKYFFDESLDQIIMGLRIPDGNNVPKKVVENKNGFSRNAPMKDWTHEELLAFIYYNNIELPKIYHYSEGFPNGTGPYFKMVRDKDTNISDMWEYVYKHDKEKVEQASKYIESAYEYLGGINK